MKMNYFKKGLALSFAVLFIPTLGSASQAAIKSATSTQYVKLEYGSTSSYGYDRGALYSESYGDGLFVTPYSCIGSDLNCMILKIDTDPFSSSSSYSLSARLSFGEGICSIRVAVPFTITDGILTTPITSYPVAALYDGDDGICGKKPMSLAVTGNSTSGYTMSFIYN